MTNRKWYLAAAPAVIYGVFFASTASAMVFDKCIPLSINWADIQDPTERESARQLELKRCAAEDAVSDSWSATLTALELVQEQLKAAANSGQWDRVKILLDKAREPLLKAKQAADENFDVYGAADLRSVFGDGLNYSFQNVGLLPLPSSFDDALEKIEIAATTPGQESKAATLAATIINQAHGRGLDLVKHLSSAAGDAVKTAHETEVDTDRQTMGKTRRNQLEGRTLDGYFGGFPERILSAWKPWLSMLILVTFAGAWLGKKHRLNPVAAAAAAGLSYLVPGTAMAGAFVFIPFMPQWLLIAATVMGTLATYYYASPVFGWLANRVGAGTPTGRRLIILGGTVDNLRAGLGGAPASSPPDAVSQMAAPVVTHGSARWGTASEMQQAGHLYARKNLPKQAGFALGRAPDTHAAFDPRFRFIGHVVTVAPTGSGKGIGAVIPNLLDYPGSALVLDVKGENSSVTARARRALGQAVYVVDPFGVNGGPGAAFNVLDRLDVKHPDCVSDSAILADALVIAEGKGESVHFDESAKIFLQGLILHVAALDEVERRNLGELRRLLTAGETEFFDLLGMMAADETTAFGIPARSANTLMGMADRERGSVLSTARRNTAFLDDPRIAAALARSDFDLPEIKAEPMTVYLVMPANRIGPNARFLRLFISSVIAAITSSNVQPVHRVAFLLDEFGQLGYMKQIEDAVSLLRGYGLAFWVFIQDLSQLKGVYPKWQTFLANSAKTFYGTDDYDTAKYISDSLGKATIEFETENEGGNRGHNFSFSGGSSMNRGQSSGTNQQFAGRELLTPDEVMRLGPEKPIVLVKGEYPYLLARLNYLSDSEYRGRFDANPYHS